jgi:hypothetical protein
MFDYVSRRDVVTDWNVLHACITRENDSQNWYENDDALLFSACF